VGAFSSQAGGGAHNDTQGGHTGKPGITISDLELHDEGKALGDRAKVVVGAVGTRTTGVDVDAIGLEDDARAASFEPVNLWRYSPRASAAVFGGPARNSGAKAFVFDLALRPDGDLLAAAL
jgi:hypothetical protein